MAYQNRHYTKENDQTHCRVESNTRRNVGGNHAKDEIKGCYSTTSMGRKGMELEDCEKPVVACSQNKFHASGKMGKVMREMGACYN